MVDEERERLAENQDTVRDANRRLQELVNVHAGQLVPFICECADITCLERVEASLGEFEVIHEDPDRYFLVPGHMRIEGQEILDRNARYEVVIKDAA